MNTKIEYFHKDEFNKKTSYEAILEGSMTNEQEAEILNCIDEEGTFIPSSFGLSGDFDCDWSGYSTSNLPATNSMTVEDFIRRACRCMEAGIRSTQGRTQTLRSNDQRGILQDRYYLGRRGRRGRRTGS